MNQLVVLLLTVVNVIPKIYARNVFMDLMLLTMEHVSLVHKHKNVNKDACLAIEVNVILVNSDTILIKESAKLGTTSTYNAV